jgi:SulP family sulfate permease
MIPSTEDAELGGPDRRARAGRYVRQYLPARSDYRGLRGSWRGDVVAGVTVGVVALPLALAFAITAGLSPEAGLITAIVAGLVAAVFGGSNLQVSGPTGAMAVVLVPIVAHYGPAAVPVVGFLAGLFVLVAAFAKVGRALAFVPWPVIEGFTVGIAVTIFLQQVPGALGVAKPAGANVAVIAARSVGDAFTHGTGGAIGLVVLVAMVMVAAPRIHTKIPGSLIAVVVATLGSVALGLHVSTIGRLPSSLPLPGLPDASVHAVTRLASAALAVALLASLESLLSAKVADGMTDGPAHDPNRELFGQGLANLASACFGGMPATGAIARSAVNARAGARTRVSALVHSLVLVLIVFFAGSLVAEIPLAALAGVLMVTAVRMVDLRNVRSVLRSTRSDAVVLILTAMATVALDLIVTVEIGLVVAAFFALCNVARTATAIADSAPVVPEIDDAAEAALLHEHVLVYRLGGALFFGAAQRFLREITAVSGVRVVILRLADLQVLDATGAQALGDIVDELEQHHITVLLKGPRAEHLRTLEAVGVLDRLAHERHVFTTLSDATTHALVHVARSA